VHLRRVHDGDLRGLPPPAQDRRDGEVARRQPELRQPTEELDPDNRVTVRHPSGWLGPGFLIGPRRDVILWGFTAGIIARLFSYLGWAQDWDRARVRDLPDHMLQGVPRGTDLAPNTPQNTRLEE
jgi:hypothetical protein